MSKLGVPGLALGAIADVAFTHAGYEQDRARGKSAAFSAVHAVGTTLLWNAFMLPAIGLSLAPLAPLVHQKLANNEGRMQRAMLPMSPYGSPDSEFAQTSRQRSLAAIEQARMNARTALGNEAGLYSPRFR